MAATMINSAFLTKGSSMSFSQAVSRREGLIAASAQASSQKMITSPRAATGTKITGTKIIKKAGVEAQKAGSRIAKKLKVISPSDKTGIIRSKVVEDGSVKLLSRVQELRLLSKAEQAGLLSLAESLGLSLGQIEKLGLLSKAESLGVLSAASNTKTPGALLTLALALLAAGPIAVYLIPEDSTLLVVVQVVLAAVAVAGGAAAFGGSKLVKSLQKA